MTCDRQRRHRRARVLAGAPTSCGGHCDSAERLAMVLDLVEMAYDRGDGGEPMLELLGRILSLFEEEEVL